MPKLIKMKRSSKERLTKFLSFTITGVLYSIAAMGLLSSPRLLHKMLKLSEVSLDSMGFAPPNTAVPEAIRGVWWIDKGAGVVTVDLNLLRWTAGAGFHAHDAFTPGYQTVSNDLTELRLWFLVTVCGIRSHVLPAHATM